MTGNLDIKIELYVGRSVDFEEEVLIRDTRDGLAIVQWHIEGVPEPTTEQLDAFEEQANIVAQNWETLAFSKNQVEPATTDADLLVVRMAGKHLGWGSKLRDDDHYEVTFFTEIPMPLLVLNEAEYNLFRDIHLLPLTINRNGDKFIFIPSGPLNPTEYHDVLLNISEFRDLQITHSQGVGDPPYMLKVTHANMEMPRVFLDQAKHDFLMSELHRTGKMLHFDNL